jgi:hypothetical protein
MSFGNVIHRFGDRVMTVTLEPGASAATVSIDISYRTLERWRFTFVALAASVCALGFAFVRFVVAPQRVPNFGVEPHPNIGDALIVMTLLTGTAAALGTWLAINTFRPVRIVRDLANERIEIRRPLRRTITLIANEAQVARRSRRYGEFWVTTVEFFNASPARRVILARLALRKEQDLHATDLACTLLADTMGVECLRIES